VKSRRNSLFIARFIATVSIGIAIAAPIRVGVFKTNGPGKYWHTNMHTAGSVIAAMLADPHAARLGPALIVPVSGFSVTQFGLVEPATGTATVQQQSEFIAALDTLEVVVFPDITDFGSSMPDTDRRARLLSFMKRKGVVSIYGTTDSYGTWAPWDSLHGARFQNWPSSSRQATLHLDSVAMETPTFRFLTRGLPDTARFLDQWMSFTTNGDVIRAKPGLTVTVTIDEASYNGGLGGTRAMGDHPMSWAREWPEGGRLFYTAVGERAQNYRDTAATTPLGSYFTRRQLYNAILWAAKVDTNGVVSVDGDKVGKASPSRFADHARLSLSGGALTVTLLRDGAHTVEIRGLDGHRVATAQVSGKTTHRFSGLSTGSVYFVVIRAEHERLVQRIALQ
jgi:hypothetical protein